MQGLLLVTVVKTRLFNPRLLKPRWFNLKWLNLYFTAGKPAPFCNTMSMGYIGRPKSIYKIKMKRVKF